MPEQYEHYITRNIRAFYRRRIIFPALYLALLAAVWIIFPLSELLMPRSYDAASMDGSLEYVFKEDTKYANITLRDLHFTGYTSTFLNMTSGYYYYTVIDDECTIILLSPSTSEEGLPTIEKASVKGRIIEGGASFDALLSSLSADLNWTDDGIHGQVSQYYLSEPAYGGFLNFLLFAFLFITGGYAILTIALYIVFVNFPVLSPCCQSLSLFGNAAELLDVAEEELATLPQLATEDMFITEHFFIETSVYGNAIVPIDEIIWIYKYSTLHKFFWYHFSISYTLHISANKHLYIQCPKNTKSDIDGIIDYLSEANHNILVGFSEDNRLKVQKLQGKPLNIEKLLAFLNRRI